MTEGFKRQDRRFTERGDMQQTEGHTDAVLWILFQT